MSEKKRGWNWDWLRALEGIDGEGLLVLIGLVIAIGLGWLIVELMVPVLLFGAYLLLVGALRRVANDRHQCEGNLARAALWGAIWASVYTLPLAGIVWLFHLAAGAALR